MATQLALDEFNALARNFSPTQLAYGQSHPNVQNMRYGRIGSGGSALNPYYASPEQKMEQQRTDLTAEYQTAYDTAKAANESRYEDIVGRYGTRYEQGVSDIDAYGSSILGGLEGMGEAEKAQIGRTYDRSGALGQQSLISSGLHSTTIAPTVQRQNEIARGNALSLADERLRRENLGYQTDIAKTKLSYTSGMSKELLDFMERRTDDYPDQSVYLQLMNQLGNTGS